MLTQLDRNADAAPGVGRMTIRLRRGRALMDFGPNKRYLRMHRIAQGAENRLYVVFDRSQQRCLVGKFQNDYQSSASMQPVHAEGEVLARLQHESIVQAIDVGIADTPYLLMERLPGADLEHVLARGPIPIGQSLNLFADIARALAHAHTRDVLHLDVKPANIWVLPNGRAKLIDFGIGASCRTLRADNAELRVSGTPYYMAPEQWEGCGLDGRTDIWSAGIALRQALEHTGGTEIDSPARRFGGCSLRCPDPRGILGEIVRRAAAFDKTERYATADQFAVALQLARATLT